MALPGTSRPSVDGRTASTAPGAPAPGAPAPGAGPVTGAGTASARQGHPKPGRVAILVLALLSSIAPLATDMYLAGFPRIAKDLGTSATSVQLTLTTFMAGLALGQLVIGPLSDRWGRRRPLLIGTLVCVLASFLCAIAPNIALLVSFRFVQGFAGAAGVVLGRAIVADTARGVAAARIFSLLMIIGGLAPVIAPLLGGALLGPVGWRGVFGVLTGAALLMLLGSYFILKESLSAARRHSGGASATLQATRTVLSNRRYLGYTLAFMFAFGSMFAYISASPFVLQTVFGLSTGWYSVAFAANALGLTGASLVSARLVSWAGPRRLLCVGLGALLIVNVVLFTLAVTGSLNATLTLILLWLSITAMGLIMGNAASLAVAQTPQSAGTGSAVLGAGQFALAAVVSPLVGLGGSGTAVPMTVVMVASATISVVALLLLTRGSSSFHAMGADTLAGETATDAGTSRNAVAA
jgi:DHA1 family bicyclomycin/chloramphenicol resistance-like MFS transporter